MANYYLVAPLTYTGPASAGFTYESTETVALGSLVEIPLGKRSSLGVVVGKVDTKPTFTTKPITRVLDIAPLPAHLLQLGAWMEDYYYSSAKAVWGTMLPAGLEKKRRIKVGAAAAAVQVEMEPALTKEQVAALKAIRESPLGILLQGVTSSGKTRVYLELASEVLAKGQDVIILVPEIALTPQTEARFRKRFGDDVIVTHSHQTEAERHLAWTAAHTATSPKVVLGPRSALFLPLKNPGLIVVDECHETSYKQEQNPRYQAVTVAGKLAQLAGAKLILGSATPGLWEVYLAEHGRLKLVKLTERANQIAPVTVNSCAKAQSSRRVCSSPWPPPWQLNVRVCSSSTVAVVPRAISVATAATYSSVHTANSP
jgi:primosomal protein N' (replication factor Y)